MTQSKAFLITLLLLVSMALTTSCTSKSTEEEDQATASIENEDALETENDSSTEVAEAQEETNNSNEETTPEKAAEEYASSESSDSTETEESIENDNSSSAPTVTPIQNSASNGQYTVQKGETLMMVSYNVYGDYRKWKSIAEMNGLAAGQALKAGTVLKYRTDWENIPQIPSGSPYVITDGDTLGLISNKAYGTSKRWKEIWSNNKQLIIDPNLIFAGFTIYVLNPTMASVY